MRNPCRALQVRPGHALTSSFLAVLFLVFNALIPPLQSPDEDVHVLRAYMLAKGVVLLESPPNMQSGGLVDEALFAYVTHAAKTLAFKPEQKVTREQADKLAAMTWSGEKVFASIPATGYYFPFIYLPQAAALQVGEVLKLSIQNSYYLARASAFFCSMALLLLAFRLHPPNPLTVALALIPMSVFQFLSTGMDGIGFALAALCMSLFMRAYAAGKESPWSSYALALSLFVLVTTRVQALPFLCLPFVLAIQRPSRWKILLAVSLLAAVLVWLVVAIRNTNDGGLHHPGHSHFDLIIYYLGHPQLVGQILWDTFTRHGALSRYRDEFIGILGWLDTSFSRRFYTVASVLLALISILTASRFRMRETWPARLTIIMVAIGCSFTVFFTLLIQWNTFPTHFVEGVQGRYFIIPMVALAYGLNGQAGFRTSAGKLSLVLLGALGLVVAFSLTQLMLRRYFIG